MKESIHCMDSKGQKMFDASIQKKNYTVDIYNNDYKYANTVSSNIDIIKY